MNTSFRAAPLALAALLISACGSTGAPQLSAAAAAQQTSTGVPVGQTELGSPTKPSVEYVRIKMSKSIFLNPPETDTPMVYLRVRDTSGQDLDLQEAVAARVRALGFGITRNAARADYTLNANVLYANEASALELAKLDETEYGDDVSGIVGNVLIGAAAGGVAGGVLGNSPDAVVGAAAGGLLGGIYGAVKEKERKERITAKQNTKFYSVLVDIELRERLKGEGVRQSNFSEESNVSSSQNSSGLGDTTSETSHTASSDKETYTETTQWRRHRTRIVAKAKGKLIAFGDVRQDFAERLAKSIAGLL